MSAEEPEEASPRPTRAEGDEAKDEASSDEASSDEASSDEASSDEASSSEASASDVDEEAPRPRKKKKKKPLPARRARKPASDEDDADDLDPLDDVKGAPSPRDDRPAFTRSFPSDPELDALVAAFERGEYARVRREAPLLAKATDRPEVRKAANELRRRLDPDPIAVYLLIAAAVLLAFLAGWFWNHPHELPGP